MESEDKKMISGRGPEPDSGFELKFDSYYKRDDATNNMDFDQTATILLPTSPIIGMKNIIQSMDYGVTREMVERIQAEVAELKNAYQGDKYLGRLLKMIDSLVRHIKRRKSEAHPEALELLHSVFDCLEDLVLIPEIAEDSKRKMVKIQTEKFKGLKEELLLHSSEDKVVKSGPLPEHPDLALSIDSPVPADLMENSAEDTLTVEPEAVVSVEMEPQPDTEKIPWPEEEQVLLDRAEEFEAIGLEEFDLADGDDHPPVPEPSGEVLTAYKAKKFTHPLESVVSNDTDTDTQIFLRSPDEDRKDGMEEGLGETDAARLDDLTTENQESMSGAESIESTEGPQVVLSNFIEENQDIDQLIEAGPTLVTDRAFQGLPGKSGPERGDWISTSDLVPREFRPREGAPKLVVTSPEENRISESRDHGRTDIDTDAAGGEEQGAGEPGQRPEVDPELQAISDKVDRLYDRWATIGDDTTTKILSQLGIDSEVLKGSSDQVSSDQDYREFDAMDPDTVVSPESGPAAYQEQDDLTEGGTELEVVLENVPEETVVVSEVIEFTDRSTDFSDMARPFPDKTELGSAGFETVDEVFPDEPTASYDLEALGPAIVPLSTREGIVQDQDGPAAEGSGSEEPRIADDSAPLISGVSPHEVLAFTLEEIKQTIRAEFRTLAAELRLWRTTK